MQNMKAIIGYDNNAVLFDAGDEIIRNISSSYMNRIVDIYTFYENVLAKSSNFVETKLNINDGALIHKKYTVSYPYEWTASMFKDALLFHLDLFIQLDAHGYTLKDALPNNILFDATLPVFVDFCSLVKKVNLDEEEWLMIDNRYNDARLNIVHRMLIPYFIIPYLAYVEHNYENARHILREKMCNNSKNIIPNWRDLKCHPESKGLIRRIWDSLSSKHKGDGYHYISSLIKKEQNFIELCRKLRQYIAVHTLVTPADSDYSLYYQSKRENFDFHDSTTWKPKQKSVCDAILKYKPISVLDIGANTGWFSIFAAKNNAKVIALEIDEACVDSIYRYSKREQLNILPLRIAFEDLEKNLFGMDYKDDPLQRDFKNVPICVAPTERLNCDMTLCLALVHHLVLGMGMTIAEVMRVLSKLTKKVLILEIVTLDDELIRSEPSFFAHINSFSKENYNVEAFMNTGKKYFKNCFIVPSHPETRKILIFKK